MYRNNGKLCDRNVEPPSNLKSNDNSNSILKCSYFTFIIYESQARFLYFHSLKNLWKNENFPLIIDRQTNSFGNKNMKGIFESKETSPIAISSAWIALVCVRVPSSQLSKAQLSWTMFWQHDAAVTNILLSSTTAL